MRTWKLGILGSVIAVAASQGWLSALNVAPPPESQPQTKPGTSLKLSFPIPPSAGHGDFVYATVTLGGKDRLFIVDTGANATLVDFKLVQFLGAAGPEATVTLANGEQAKLTSYRMPSLVVGGETLQTRGWAGATDMAGMSRVTGRPIEGILGVDALVEHVVRMDFGRHTLEIGDFPLEKDAGKDFPLEWNGDLPSIAMDFLGIGDVLVQLDSGHEATGRINQLLAQRLAPAEFVSFKGSAQQLVGTTETLQYVVHRRWSLAGVAFQDTVLSQGDRNTLGLEALADFVVTFDFPHNKVYLKKRWDTHESMYFWSFPVVSEKGNFYLRQVDEHCQAQGLKEGDQILQLDRRDVQGIELWRLKDQMQQLRTTVLKVRRGEQTLDVRIQGELLPIHGPAKKPAP